jgi:hypothetical protein
MIYSIYTGVPSAKRSTKNKKHAKSARGDYENLTAHQRSTLSSQMKRGTQGKNRRRKEKYGIAHEERTRENA